MENEMGKKTKPIRKMTHPQANIEVTNVDVEEKTKPNSPGGSNLEKGEDVENTTKRLPSSKGQRLDWNAVTGVTSAIALVLLAIATFYSAAQIRTTRQIAQAQSVMEYFNLLQEYNDIQIKLVDGGEWSTPGKGPATAEELFRVRRYMGLLEQIEVLVNSDVIELDVADGNYSHRIRAIYNNDVIRRMDLENQAYRWQRFLRLVRRLENMPVYQGLRKSDEGRIPVSPSPPPQ